MFGHPDPLIEIEYDRGRVKRLRVGRCAVTLFAVLTVAFSLATESITFDQVVDLLSEIVRLKCRAQVTRPNARASMRTADDDEF
jgi:hypothetical protein